MSHCVCGFVFPPNANCDWITSMGRYNGKLRERENESIIHTHRYVSYAVHRFHSFFWCCVSLWYFPRPFTDRGDATGPCLALYLRLRCFGLCCISLIASLLRKLDAVQRRMLRCIVGRVRIPDEDWEVTVKRMRDKINRATKLISLSPWSYYIGDRYWMFVQRVAISDAGI